jgi:hypothetical protein
MKNCNSLFFSSLIAILLCLTSGVNGQDSYGSSCNIGRQVIVINKKYVVEFIAPIGWQRDKSFLISKGVNNLYPAIDSINRITNIYIQSIPNVISSTNIDSFIQDEKNKYPDEKSMTWEIQKYAFHNSITDGKLFLIKDSENNIKELKAYIMPGDYTVTFVFKTANSKSYNEYVNDYTTLLSSIRCSKF